jgi:ubiquitin carboxyl-terminal hydrolase 5/13
MDSIQALAITCRVAAAHDSVLNTECCYTFYSPYNGPNDQGIVVHLESFMGTVQELAMLEDTGSSKEGIFVRIVKERVAKEKDAAMEEADGATEAAAAATTAATAPTKLGIGMDGGFLSDDDKYETISKHSVVVLRKNDTDGTLTVVTELPYTDETKASFPTQVSASVDSILNHVGMTVQQDVKVWQLDADEDIVVSKYADSLPFVDNGVVIDPNPVTWKCAKNGATENIWLNLSDGYIGGGRQNWDGSGGSNGALDHYEATGKLYPLVVKLGTITADLSTADCYSYAAEEDGPVKIPNLAALLEKRGIYVAGMYVDIVLFCFLYWLFVV